LLLSTGGQSSSNGILLRASATTHGHRQCFNQLDLIVREAIKIEFTDDEVAIGAGCRALPGRLCDQTTGRRGRSRGRGLRHQLSLINHTRSPGSLCMTALAQNPQPGRPREQGRGSSSGGRCTRGDIEHTLETQQTACEIQFLGLLHGDSASEVRQRPGPRGPRADWTLPV